MAESTNIEWCDSSWSPWEGCTKVSPGCDHCYAEGMNRWLRKGENWGPGAPRRIYSEDHWQKPAKWNARPFYACQECGWRGETPANCPGCAAEVTSASRRVFPSVCDPFDNEVDPAWRARLFALIAQTPRLTWLLLTKRIGNVAKMIEAPGMQKCGLPPNIWLGATVVNQEEADRDVPKLLATPARVRFLSIEPMLGPVDLRDIGDDGWRFPFNALTGEPDAPKCIAPRMARSAAIDWVICGGESGPGARPMHVEWVRSIVQQCESAGVPVLVKQLGAAVLDDGMSSPGGHWPGGMVREPIPRHAESDPPFVMRLKHRKGGDMAEWPDDLRVREFPHA